MSKNLTKIEVVTLPNGYSLNIDGSEHMYFNEIDLLAGFMSRIGSGESRDMEKGEILNTLFAVMLGERYTSDVTKLKKTVESLNETYCERLDTLCKQTKSVETSIEVHNQLRQKISETSELVEQMEKKYSEAKRPYDDFNKRIMNLELHITKLENSFRCLTDKAENTLALIEAKYKDIKSKESEFWSKADMLIGRLERNVNGDITEEEVEASNSKTDTKKPKKRDTKKPTTTKKGKKTTTKRGGSRAKNDAAVLKELESQLQEHWEGIEQK